MATRRIRIHAFASTKGGVGKSTLALLAARSLAGARRPVLVDLDLTGSSLADGLDLEAPALPLDDTGRFLPDATSLGWLSLQGVLLRRNQRSRHASAGAPFIQLPYANDALLARQPIAIREWLWRDPSDHLRVLPASSISADVKRATRVLAEVDGLEWRDSLIATVRDLAAADEEITDIVLDLPPGTWGFSHAALVAMVALSNEVGPDQIEWSANPVFVTSPDRNALVPAIEYIATHDRYFKLGILPVVNRSLESPEFIRRAVLAKLSEPLRSLGFEERLIFFDDDRQWATLFQGHVYPQPLTLRDHQASLLRLG